MYNGHGDATALLSSTGAILGAYYYDAFGVLTESTGTFNNPYTYAGYQYDKETGLYYLQSRMYDPVIARFLQEDTYRGKFNDPLSLNLYSYCYNNPLIYYDPNGHVVTVWDRLNLTASQIKAVEKATTDYIAAQKRKSPAEMEAAHQEAEAAEAHKKTGTVLSLNNLIVKKQ